MLAGALAGLGVAFGLGACGDGTEPPVIPPECEDPPTFAVDVAPIIERTCLRCHSEELAGIFRNNAPVGMDYDRLELFPDEAAKSAFVDAITSGRQPPPGADPPSPTTEEERITASAWKTCGYLP